MATAEVRPTSRARRALRRLREQTGGDPILLSREVAYRAGRRAREMALDRGYGSLVARPGGSATFRPLPIELDAADLRGPPLRDTLAEVRAVGDAAERHEFDVLGSGPTDLGDAVDWHRDFKSGYRWPQLPYQRVRVTRLDDDSDAKVPWELSRCHHLLALARAARLIGEERYARGLAAGWESWLEVNPPGVGINWTNPMEVAIRAVNWAWAMSTAPDAVPAPLRARIAAALRIHGRHIEWNLEGTPRLRSNHYLADVLGLLVIGAVLEGREAGRWRRRGRRALTREIGEQVREDGLGFEASVGYHGLALEMFLVGRWVTAAIGDAMPAEYDDRLRRMVDATHAIRIRSGLVPRFGDSDDGRILPATPARPASLDHLLWGAAAVIGTAPPPSEAGAADALLTYGTSQRAALAAREPRRERESVALTAGGIWMLRGERAEVAVRCGDVGQNGNGGHAHNDACAYELFVDGMPVIVDPGTYVYTADPDARNAFRATAAHATVQVAGAEINPIDPARLFELRPLANTDHRDWSVGDEGVSLRVGHDGYRRLPQRVIHERRFSLDRRGDRLEVGDSLDGRGEIEAVARIPLAAGAEVSADGEGAMVHAGGVTVRVTSDGPVNIKRGWVSHSYGRRARGPVIELPITGRLPVERVHRVEVLG